MSIYIDTTRVLNVLVHTLSHTIIPNIQDPIAREEAEFALGIIVGNVLSQPEYLQMRVQQQRAKDLSKEVLATLARASRRSDAFEAADYVRLLSALDEEQTVRARSKELIASISHSLARRDWDKFPPPTEDQLTACLRTQYVDEPHIRATNVSPLLGGNGKQTILFDQVAADGRIESLVMRRDIPEAFNRTTVANEFPLLRTLYERGLAVPEPLWIDASNTVSQTPYMITRKLPGRLAGDGRGAFPDAILNPVGVMADVLAKLHTLDPRSIGVAGMSDQPWNEATLLQNLGGWEHYYRESVEIPIVAVDIAFAWLRTNVQAGLQAPSIVHGEVGFHNLLVENGRLTALLDWEMAHIGSAVEDLCYVKDQIERSGSFAQFIDIYVERGGSRPSPSALEYYDIYRLTRNAGIFAAGVDSFNKGNTDKLRMTYFSSVLLAAYVKRLDKTMRDILRTRRFAVGTGTDGP